MEWMYNMEWMNILYDFRIYKQLRHEVITSIKSIHLSRRILLFNGNHYSLINVNYKNSNHDCHLVTSWPTTPGKPTLHRVLQNKIGKYSTQKPLARHSD